MMEMSNRNTSPYRRHQNDEEARTVTSNEYEDEASSDPFEIYITKDASLDRLKRWRQAALVLNASRRFPYTLDLKKEEEKQQIRRKIKAHAQAMRAARLFKEAGEKQEVPGTTTSASDFGIDPEQLVSITRDLDFSALEQFGGVKGIADILKANEQKGIHGDDDDLLKRRNAFGSNTYPRKKGQSFWNFVWDAFHDKTLLILIIAAVASLCLGIKSEGIKEGWYNGGSIILAVLIVIVVTAASDNKEYLQLRKLNEEKRNIHSEVIRGGRRLKVSIFDIVVGDVVPIQIGDLVPADGILIFGHSLAIDESSMTQETKPVDKGSKAPFLMSGCKVANGYGTMLICNKFNARKPDEINVFKGVTRNYLFMGIMDLTIGLQFTSTVRLSWKMWLVSIAIGFMSWPLAILGKLIPVPETPFSEFCMRVLPRCRTSRVGF